MTGNWELTPRDAATFLRDPVRRTILWYLYERQRPVGVEELARQLTGTTEDSTDYGTNLLTVDDLQQTHLPELQSVGLISLTPRRGTWFVEPTWKVAQFEAELRPHGTRRYYVQ